MTFLRIRHKPFFIFATLLAFAVFGQLQQREFQVHPAQSSVKFTLGDVLHTVRGTFKVKHGDLRIDPSGRMSGEIVVDATSGDSSNGMRDRKMHKEVLESERYPEISFRPDRIEGPSPSSGNS